MRKNGILNGVREGLCSSRYDDQVYGYIMGNGEEANCIIERFSFIRGCKHDWPNHIKIIIICIKLRLAQQNALILIQLKKI